MPQVTLNLAEHCPVLLKLLQQYDTNSYDHKNTAKFLTKKYPSTSVDDDVHFEEIHSNAAQTLENLDNIKRAHKPFLCIQDKVDHDKEHEAENEKVYALLKDFYTTMYPFPSQFETTNLNKKLHTSELGYHMKKGLLKKICLNLMITTILLCALGLLFPQIFRQILGFCFSRLKFLILKLKRKF